MNDKEAFKNRFIDLCVCVVNLRLFNAKHVSKGFQLRTVHVLNWHNFIVLKNKKKKLNKCIVWNVNVKIENSSDELKQLLDKLKHWNSYWEIIHMALSMSSRQQLRSSGNRSKFWFIQLQKPFNRLSLSHGLALLYICNKVVMAP